MIQAEFVPHAMGDIGEREREIRTVTVGDGDEFAKGILEPFKPEKRAER